MAAKSTTMVPEMLLYKFSDREKDNTGLDYFGARFYDPEMAKEFYFPYQKRPMDLLLAPPRRSCQICHFKWRSNPKPLKLFKPSQATFFSPKTQPSPFHLKRPESQVAWGKGTKGLGKTAKVLPKSVKHYFANKKRILKDSQ
jgi:hypothetical protein